MTTSRARIQVWSSPVDDAREFVPIGGGLETLPEDRCETGDEPEGGGRVVSSADRENEEGGAKERNEKMERSGTGDRRRPSQRRFPQ